MADKNDPIGYAKYVRQLPSTERLLRQFLKLETGLGKNAAYERGHTWNFEWCSEDPKRSRPDLVKRVRDLMDQGMSFEEAFDETRAQMAQGSREGE